MRPPPLEGRERWVAGAFALVVASFILSTAISQERAAAIARDALDIQGAAAPSIERLAAARAELHRLALLLDDHVDAAAEGRPGDAAAVREARRRVGHELDGYFALPTFPGERELWERLHTAMARLDTSIGRALGEAGRGAAAPLTVHKEVRPAVEESADAMLRIIELNASLASARAVRIDRERRDSLRLAVGMDLVAALLTAVAAMSLLRSLRRHAALVSEHGRLLERRADELEMFAGRVAHDIQNPLAAIDLAVARIESAANLEAARTAARRARRSLKRAHWITRDLLGFARAGARPLPGASAEVAATLGGVVEDLRPLAEEDGVDLEVAIDLPEGAAVACAPGVLTCLTSNLLHNALKYIGEGPLPRVRLRAYQAPGGVRVQVEDTGPGVDPALRDVVFLPFVRGVGLSQPGIGLGLATVKRLCESHGGAVGVEAGPGPGGVFWFELPAAGGATAGAPPPTSERGDHER